MKSKHAYMIRRKSDGLFSSGGMSPKFDKKGKIWGTVGALKNHLVFAYDNYYNRGSVKLNANFYPYLECEIVVFELTPEEKPAPFVLSDFLIGKLEETAQKEVADQIKYKSAYREVKITYPDGTKKVINPLNDNPSNDN